MHPYVCVAQNARPVRLRQDVAYLDKSSSMGLLLGVILHSILIESSSTDACLVCAHYLTYTPELQAPPRGQGMLTDTQRS